MKRFALLLVSVLVAGWASPVMATHSMAKKLFWVEVWEGGLIGGRKVDEGLIYFEWYDPPDEAPQFVFHSGWRSGTGCELGVWSEEDNIGPNGRFDRRWCSWAAYYEYDDVEPWPYDDFTAWYYKPTKVVIGIIERTNEEDDLLFYGEEVPW